MKNLFPKRIYVDLFSGPGRVEIKGRGDIVPGSPINALSIRDPFTHYIFCEKKKKHIEALEERVRRHLSDAEGPPHVAYVRGDVNKKVPEIVGHLESVGPALAFCFSDPTNLDVHFDTIRRVAEGRRVDFLCTLMLPLDAGRNVQRYFEEGHTRVERFLGDPAWRKDWQEAEGIGKRHVPFLARRYAQQMQSIGYLPVKLDRMYPIRSNVKNLPLYFLAFFSKNPRGYDFWNKVLKYADPQLQIDFSTVTPPSAGI